MTSAAAIARDLPPRDVVSAAFPPVSDELVARDHLTGPPETRYPPVPAWTAHAPDHPAEIALAAPLVPLTEAGGDD